MVEKIQFEVEVLVKEIRDDEEVMALDSGYSMGKFIVSLDYYLTLDRVRRKIIPLHGYNFDDLNYYVLNMAEVL